MVFSPHSRVELLGVPRMHQAVARFPKCSSLCLECLPSLSVLLLPFICQHLSEASSALGRLPADPGIQLWAPMRSWRSIQQSFPELGALQLWLLGLLPHPTVGSLEAGPHPLYLCDPLTSPVFSHKSPRTGLQQAPRWAGKPLRPAVSHVVLTTERVLWQTPGIYLLVSEA